jgi:hypothetical protein
MRLHLTPCPPNHKGHFRTFRCNHFNGIEVDNPAGHTQVVGQG